MPAGSGPPSWRSECKIYPSTRIAISADFVAASIRVANNV
jgi:hypothetical protein